jgi:hypothetical protein
VLGCTGRGLINDGGKTGAAALRDNDTVGTGTLGRADYGTQIVGVTNLVTDDDKGCFATLLSHSQNVAYLAVFTDSGQGNDTLVGMGLAHKVQFAAVSLNNYNALFTSFGGDVSQSFVNVTLGNENLVYGSSGTQSLNDCVAAFDYVVSNLVIFFNHLYITPILSA